MARKGLVPEADARTGTADVIRRDPPWGNVSKSRPGGSAPPLRFPIPGRGAAKLREAKREAAPVLARPPFRLSRGRPADESRPASRRPIPFPENSSASTPPVPGSQVPSDPARRRPSRSSRRFVCESGAAPGLPPDRICRRHSGGQRKGYSLLRDIVTEVRCVFGYHKIRKSKEDLTWDFSTF